MDDASPAPPPPGSSATMERKLSPGVLLLIAILAMVFFIFGLLNLLAHNLLRLRRARRRRRRVGDALAAAAGQADGSSPTAFQGQLQQLFHLHDAGVDQAFIDALPVFPYRAVVSASAAGKGGDGDAEPFDCAVCLCEFADDDKLRLLPTCGHAFHVPCIDAWLLSHSTCPLCRGSILAADVEYEPGYSSPSSSLLLLRSYGLAVAETGVARDGGDCDPGARDGGDDESPSPKDEAEEEVVEVKLGKLRSVDGGTGNASARDLGLTADGTGSSNGNGRGSLGQRRCLSMGSYEYVMADHAALRVTIKATTPKRRPASSSRSSRRRHALSACDIGCPKKAGAWETAVTGAAAASDALCGDGAASLSRDSFSTSKIWMASAARREEDGRLPGPAAEPAAGERRAASFRWPAMVSVCKRHRRGEEPCDVEAGTSGDNGVSSSFRAEERPPSVARAAMLWVAGGRQGSHS